MKKIFISVILSFLVMFFIWTMMCWINYPDFMEYRQYYHLDLYGMLQRFNIGQDINDDFTFTFWMFIESMKKLNTSDPVYKILLNNFTGGVSNGWLIAGQGILAVINPVLAIANSFVVLGYLIVLVIQFLSITTVLATAIFDFIFNPILIWSGPSIPPLHP